MWIVSNDSFVSVVEDRLDPSMVYVRARRSADLMNFMKLSDVPYSVTENGLADYQFRLHISKTIFSDIVKKNAENINYDNFKSSIEDDIDLSRFAHEVWCAGGRNLGGWSLEYQP